MRGSMVIHTTTAMHDNQYTPPPDLHPVLDLLVARSDRCNCNCNRSSEIAAGLCFPEREHGEIFQDVFIGSAGVFFNGRGFRGCNAPSPTPWYSSGIVPVD
ncbi:unnamed protein product [Laminaria digitata]